MRKILSLLGAITLVGTASTSTSVIACEKGEDLSPVQKTNLNTIIELTGLNLVADGTKEFKDFDNQILNANEFKNKPTLTVGYSIKYYYHCDKQADLTNNPQYKDNSFCVEIEASKEDTYWTGKTSLISIIIN